MFRTSRINVSALAVSIAVASLLAACQAGASPSSGGAASVPESVAESMAESAAPSEAASAEPSVSATVDVGSTAALGDYLTDAGGNTLYVFLNDSPGVTSCIDSCVQTWPPFTVDAGTTPTAANGISGALGTIQRDDGSTQVTLEGWPLYYFAADVAPGDTNGQGVGNVWFVAQPDGSVPAGAATLSDNPYTY